LHPQMPTEQRSSALTLSAEDVSRLLKDTSSETRIDMTNKIAGAYSSQAFNPKEILVAEQVFRLLLRDTELRVRVSLAEHVKDSDQIPRDIIMAMARDVEEVSLPVLQCSEVLTDNDLVELVRSTQEVSRYLAVSKRRKVSPIVTELLIEKGDDKVAAALVDNKGAEISEAGYGKIIQTYNTNENLMQLVSARPALPIATVGKLVNAVSATLGETLKKKYKLSNEQIQYEIEKTREKETLGLVRLSTSEDEVEKLINQLYAYQGLTPSIILSALCQGNFIFFEMALSRLSNIPLSNTRKLISDQGELGFRAIYNKSGLPDAMFPAVKLLLSIVRSLDAEGVKPASSRYANHVVERILQHSEDSNMENLSYIIALVRRNLGG
jgi:uncharacterized protein (DUF2336 family)